MTRMWPSREEWAADAARWARTACYPLERVPEEAEHYLTSDEVAEMWRLHMAVSAAARPVLTAEIDRLNATLPQPVPTRVADRIDWCDRATPEQMAAHQRMSTLKHIRRDVGRVASGRTDPLAGRWNPFDFTVLAKQSAGLLSGLDGWSRLAELDTKWETSRQEAADQALAEAVACEVAKRNSDEGWAKELKRRARIDGDHLTTEETSNHDR